MKNKKRNNLDLFKKIDVANDLRAPEEKEQDKKKNLEELLELLESERLKARKEEILDEILEEYKKDLTLKQFRVLADNISCIKGGDKRKKTKSFIDMKIRKMATKSTGMFIKQKKGKK